MMQYLAHPHGGAIAEHSEVENNITGATGSVLMMQDDAFCWTLKRLK